VCIIVAGRPQQGERVMPLARRVNVGPLSSVDIVAAASQLLSCPVTDALAQALVARSMGNALVLTILLRHLIALRAIAPSASGSQVLVDLNQLKLPTNAMVLMHANHALLPPEAQALLLAAAHIGQVVESGQLFRVIDGVRDVAGVLRGLTDVGVMEALPPSAGVEQWAFRSTVELEAIPARLDASQSRLLQQRVADVLAKDLASRFTLESGERLAAHLFAADARAAAAEVSARCGERAASLGLFDVAGEHYKRALAVEWRGLSTGPATASEEKAARPRSASRSASAVSCRPRTWRRPRRMTSSASTLTPACEFCTQAGFTVMPWRRASCTSVAGP
jgi:hypothetical protein